MTESSLKIARIVMLLKVADNMVGIAIHQAFQQRHKIALDDVVFEIL